MKFEIKAFEMIQTTSRQLIVGRDFINVVHSPAPSFKSASGGFIVASNFCGDRRFTTGMEIVKNERA
jgi:hypothetical protein